MKLKEEITKTPICSAIIVALFAVAAFSLPNIGLWRNETANFVLTLVFRGGAFVFAVVLAAKLNFDTFLGFKKPDLAQTFLLILGFLVCVNNFPIIGLISGNVVIEENADILRFVIFCVAVGASEEAVFRGLVLPIVGLKFNGKKRGEFFTVLISSAIFALCHAFNVFSGDIGGTLLQVGYTFLTGGLFGAAYVFTRNLFIPVLLHVIFDIGGLVFQETDGIAVGNMWDTVTVIITALLGTLATLLFAVKLWNSGDNPAYQK